MYMFYTTKMVGPLPGPCVCGSFSAPGCPFPFYIFNINMMSGDKTFEMKHRHIHLYTWSSAATTSATNPPNSL